MPEFHIETNLSSPFRLKPAGGLAVKSLSADDYCLHRSSEDGQV